MQDRTHTLKSFASSADWIKSLHFSEPVPTASKGAATERSVKRRKLGNYTGPEPSVEQIEAEFWRIIEMPDDVSSLPVKCLAVSTINRSVQESVAMPCLSLLSSVSITTAAANDGS